MPKTVNSTSCFSCFGFHSARLETPENKAESRKLEPSRNESMTALPKLKLPPPGGQANPASRQQVLPSPKPGSNPVRTVSRAVHAYLDIGVSAVADARDILCNGPENQIFSLVSGKGKPRLWLAVLLAIETQAVAWNEGEDDVHKGFKEIFSYLREKKISVGLHGVSMDSPLSKARFKAGCGSGACHDYASIATVSALEKLRNRKMPFEISRVVLKPVEGEDKWKLGKTWNAPHSVLVLKTPGETNPENIVVIDPWVKSARPALLSEMDYKERISLEPEQEDFKFIQQGNDPLMVKFDAAEEQPFDYFSDLPTLAELKNISNVLSPEDVFARLEAALEKSIEDNDKNSVEEISSFLGYLRKAEKFYDDAYHPQKSGWKKDLNLLLQEGIYQEEKALGDAATHYRTVSGSLDLSIEEHLFENDLSRSLSPASRQAAEGHVLSWKPPPMETDIQ